MQKVLIITALKLEFDAVRKYLKNQKPEKVPDSNAIYINGEYVIGGTSFNILLVEAGAGNTRATDESSRAIQYFKPDHAFFVGVAGGIKDVNLGDVVASSKVIGYEVGKDLEAFKPRADVMNASYELEQLAKHVSREAKWGLFLKRKAIPASFIGAIAAGEKVIASTQSHVFKIISTHFSETLAVDMEGIGFLVAARPYTTHAIEIRGISDMIDNKEGSDAQGSQPIAAENAAAFTFEMLNQLSVFSSKSIDKLNDVTFKNDLVNMLSELYEQGPETDNVWKRAGGNVSILSNSSSRKSQWFDAIDKLLKGGGGEQISLNSLFTEALSDYPQNEKIKELSIQYGL